MGSGSPTALRADWQLAGGLDIANGDVPTGEMAWRPHYTSGNADSAAAPADVYAHTAAEYQYTAMPEAQGEHGLPPTSDPVRITSHSYEGKGGRVPVNDWKLPPPAVSLESPIKARFAKGIRERGPQPEQEDFSQATTLDSLPLPVGVLPTKKFSSTGFFEGSSVASAPDAPPSEDAGEETQGSAAESSILAPPMGLSVGTFPPMPALGNQPPPAQQRQQQQQQQGGFPVFGKPLVTRLPGGMDDQIAGSARSTNLVGAGSPSKAPPPMSGRSMFVPPVFNNTRIDGGAPRKQQPDVFSPTMPVSGGEGKKPKASLRRRRSVVSCRRLLWLMVFALLLGAFLSASTTIVAITAVVNVTHASIVALAAAAKGMDVDAATAGVTPVVRDVAHYMATVSRDQWKATEQLIQCDDAGAMCRVGKWSYHKASVGGRLAVDATKSCVGVAPSAWSHGRPLVINFINDHATLLWSQANGMRTVEGRQAVVMALTRSAAEARALLVHVVQWMQCVGQHLQQSGLRSFEHIIQPAAGCWVEHMGVYLDGVAARHEEEEDEASMSETPERVEELVTEVEVVKEGVISEEGKEEWEPQMGLESSGDDETEVHGQAMPLEPENEVIEDESVAIQRELSAMAGATSQEEVVVMPSAVTEQQSDTPASTDLAEGDDNEEFGPAQEMEPADTSMERGNKHADVDLWPQTPEISESLLPAEATSENALEPVAPEVEEVKKLQELEQSLEGERTAPGTPAHGEPPVPLDAGSIAQVELAIEEETPSAQNAGKQEEVFEATGSIPPPSPPTMHEFEHVERAIDTEAVAGVDIEAVVEEASQQNVETPTDIIDRTPMTAGDQEVVETARSSVPAPNEAIVPEESPRPSAQVVAEIEKLVRKTQSTVERTIADASQKAEAALQSSRDLVAANPAAALAIATTIIASAVAFVLGGAHMNRSERRGNEPNEPVTPRAGMETAVAFAAEEEVPKTVFKSARSMLKRGQPAPDGTSGVHSRSVRGRGRLSAPARLAALEPAGFDGTLEPVKEATEGGVSGRSRSRSRGPSKARRSKADGTEKKGATEASRKSTSRRQPVAM